MSSSSRSPNSAPGRSALIYGAIEAIPTGLVATYGQVAMLAEIPRGHRVVAAALKGCDPALDLPWQRVVAKHSRTKGRIALGGEQADDQRQRLAAEGVEVDDEGRICLRRFGWLPLD